MTLAEIESLPQEMLTPAIVAKVLDCDPQGIRMQARFRPDLLGFPTICVKSRVKIPKAGFLDYCRNRKLS